MCIFYFVEYFWVFVISLPSRNNQKAVSQEVMKCLAILVVCVVGAAVAGNVHGRSLVSCNCLSLESVCAMEEPLKLISKASRAEDDYWSYILCNCRESARQCQQAKTRLRLGLSHPLGRNHKVYILFGRSEWEHQRQLAFYQLLSSIDENNINK